MIKKILLPIVGIIAIPFAVMGFLIGEEVVVFLAGTKILTGKGLLPSLDPKDYPPMPKCKPARLPRPPIICLCGSTRFTEQMLIKQWDLTKRGFIVLSWCALPDSYFKGEDKSHIGDQEGVKEKVDEIHKRKIDMADEVFVLNVAGYIDESTRNEIEYAKSKNKTIRYLEAE